MAVSLGNFGKFTTLTGAGWSRNWGGRIAAEVWQSIMDHPRIQSNDRLRQLLLDEPSFEVALGATLAAPFSNEDRTAFEEALLAAFQSIDREIARPDHSPWINIYGVQRFLFRFSNRMQQGINTGYLFTLNQDLWFERHLYNEHVTNAPPPALPGIQARAGRRWFTPNIGHCSTDFITSPVEDLEATRLQGQTNIIKQHGSFNWRTADGRNLLVVGTEKTNEISKVPLLSWYANIFREVLSAGDMRLMIIGYGFADEHINEVIANAITRHGLRVFIWNTAQDLKSRVLAAPFGAAIWGGVISTASRQMIEVFPSNQAETEEYRRICQSFFGQV